MSPSTEATTTAAGKRWEVADIFREFGTAYRHENIPRYQEVQQVVQSGQQFPSIGACQDISGDFFIETIQLPKCRYKKWIWEKPDIEEKVGALRGTELVAE
jgi:hypothetical protein